MESRARLTPIVQANSARAAAWRVFFEASGRLQGILETRLKRIEAAFENPDFTEEEHIRIGFAIDRHKKNIERLKLMIQKAKANKDSMTIIKN